MSRWFRSYVGMCRDPKLISVAAEAEQGLDRVYWVWGVILESATEIDDDGRFEFDAQEASEFINAPISDVGSILAALIDVRLIDQSRVVWPKFCPGEDPAGRPQADIWRKLREFVFKRDDYTCRYCGVRAGRLECDHVIPVARGGEHSADNLATACFPCNRSKRDKLIEEWRR